MFAAETRPVILVTGCQKYREYLTPAMRRFSHPEWRTIGIIGGAAIGGGIAFWTCEPGDYWAPIFGGGALGLSLGQSYGQHRADLAAIKACVDTARQQRDNTMEQHVAELKKCLGRLGYWF